MQCVLNYSQIDYSFPFPPILLYCRPSSALTSRSLSVVFQFFFLAPVLLIPIFHDSITARSNAALHHLLKGEHVLIWETCEYVTFQAKGYLWALCDKAEGQIILDYLGGSNVIAKVLLRRRQECQRRRDVKTLYCWQGIEVSFRSRKRQRNRFFPRASRVNTDLATPCC